MEGIWFVEKLTSNLKFTDQLISESNYLPPITQNSCNEGGNEGRNDLPSGIVRVHMPCWKILENHPSLLESNRNSRFYLVKLGFEFDLPKELYSTGYRYTYARCGAMVWSARSKQPAPRVYDIFPKRIFDGEPRKVGIKIGPELKIGDIGGSLGALNTELGIGHIMPTVNGWMGENQIAPYWDIRPQNKEMVGIHNMWLVIDVPNGCEAVRLATRVRAEMQTRVGPLTLGPKLNGWKSRPSVIIF